jgi:putative transposase
MSISYHTKSHSKFLLKAHLVFATKYRKKLFKGSLDEDMKQIIFEISRCQKWAIDIMQSYKDHIHILVDYEPVTSVFEIVHKLKQLSTYRIYRKCQYRNNYGVHQNAGLSKGLHPLA